MQTLIDIMYNIGFIYIYIYIHLYTYCVCVILLPSLALFLVVDCHRCCDYCYHYCGSRIEEMRNQKVLASSESHDVVHHVNAR